jgi:hypothetical protein
MRVRAEVMIEASPTCSLGGDIGLSGCRLIDFCMLRAFWHCHPRNIFQCLVFCMSSGRTFMFQVG